MARAKGPFPLVKAPSPVTAWVVRFSEKASTALPPASVANTRVPAPFIASAEGAPPVAGLERSVNAPVLGLRV